MGFLSREGRKSRVNSSLNLLARSLQFTSSIATGGITAESEGRYLLTIGADEFIAEMLETLRENVSLYDHLSGPIENVSLYDHFQELGL